MNNPEPPMFGMRRGLAPLHPDQLPNLFVILGIGVIATLMRPQDERFAVTLCKNRFRRNVVAVGLVARQKVLTAQVAKREIANFLELILS
jgi:hypothetical protein